MKIKNWLIMTLMSCLALGMSAQNEVKKDIKIISGNDTIIIKGGTLELQDAVKVAEADAVSGATTKTELSKSTDKKECSKKDKKSRLTLGGYGEAIMTYNFFSDKYLRYTDAERYKDDNGHGRFDLPHVVLFLGYDFGKGWSLGTEIEFEHGGVGAAMEIEEEEGGEYETEVERGGEVVLEQMWIQKSFSKAANLKFGHIIVPIGATNAYHMPTEFFTNYRPQGESTIMPCTWHETGISFWGQAKDWRYEAMFITGLDSDRFGQKGWVKGGAGSPYEFKIANAFAGAFRVDNFSIPYTRLSLSGYAGNSFKNTLSPTKGEKYKGVTGTVAIGAFDFCFNNEKVIVRGNFDYGHLTDSELITRYNMSMRKDSPSPKQAVASDAIAGGVEAGYDMFSSCAKLNNSGHKLFIFGRYEYYDSMFRTEGTVQDAKWCGRHRVAAGLNYFPCKEIVIKGEYSVGLLNQKYNYNNEPSISLGIAFTGLFTK